MSVSNDAFKQYMAQFASGVAIVTTQHNGKKRGLTVSDFASVSLSPPLVLMNIEQEARSHEPLSKGAGFTVNMLKESQEDLCLSFAEPGASMEKRFEAGDFRERDPGGPYLSDALCWIACEQKHAYDGGDHTIFVGEVVDGDVETDGEPLLYFRGDFGSFTPFGDWEE